MMELEERAVADRLDGIPTPSECTRLVGHDSAMKKLTHVYASGKMHHAWLISGPRGIGKASLAFCFAKHIFSQPNQTSAPELYDAATIPDTINRQVSQGAHPELLHLTRPWDPKAKKFKTQLTIEEVRRTKSFYGMTAGAGGWRITVVDCADDMNANAANALLKILEEPPKRSVFFVLTHAAGSLLPTIRSRCQMLSLQPLSAQSINTVLDQLKVLASEADRDRASRLSEGSVRRAIQLIHGDVMKDYNTFEKLMETQATGNGTDWGVVHKIADNISRKGREQELGLFLDLVMGWIGKQARHNKRAALSELASWAEVWEKASHSIAQAEAFNLDKKQLILSLFENLFTRNRS